MPRTNLPSRQRHFYEVQLDAGGGVVYTGKGSTKAAALAAARGLAQRRGGFTTPQANALTQLGGGARSLIGPKPRTFAGNKRIP